MTLDELKAFFLVDGQEYAYWPPGATHGGHLECTPEILALIAAAERLQARVKELESAGHAEFERLQLRIAVLESSGAAAFNAWRASSGDVIGAMHVLREVVGAEFVDGQRLKK